MNLVRAVHVPEVQRFPGGKDMGSQSRVIECLLPGAAKTIIVQGQIEDHLFFLRHNMPLACPASNGPDKLSKNERPAASKSPSRENVIL